MMNLPSHLAATISVLALLSTPAIATPRANIGPRLPVAVERQAPQLIPVCHEERNRYEEDEGNGESEFDGEGDGGLVTTLRLEGAGGIAPIPVDCEGSGYHDEGPGATDRVVASIEAGIEHCGQYTDVWRIDCISDELERMAQRMPKANEYRRAKAEILAASAKLRALAQQNADPRQPPVRRAATVGERRRTTTRPITAVAPNRVAAANRAADAVISELSTTLLRSAGNSATTARELMRVSQAVDSTKVLLRSI